MASDLPKNQMVTAQWLLGGGSVYWTDGRGWTDEFSDGAVHAGEEAAAKALAAADEFVRDRVVIGTYLIDVDVDAGTPKPTSARERIRAAHGTTFPIDHGSWSAMAVAGRQEEH
jgi:hypothetical protein